MSRPASDRVQSALAALERSQLRRTPQRLAIVRAFVDDDTHPTAQQIFDRLRDSMPSMSFATVYNTLDALERAGSCRTLRLGNDSSARFDPHVAPHDHAVCRRCGAVRDVPQTRQATRARPAASPPLAGFDVQCVERVYHGVCADCARPRRSTHAARSSSTR